MLGLDLRRSACALLASSITLAAATPLPGRAVHSGPPTGHSALAAFDDDEDIFFSNDGPLPLLRGDGPKSDTGVSLTFETDVCGMVSSVRNNRSRLTHSAFTEGPDGDEDYDPQTEAQTLVSRWLSMHPEIGVVSQGIDKWCDGGADLGDDVYPEDIA